MICGEDAFELKCDNKVVAFLQKLNKEMPKGVEGCKIRPELSIDMGCCHQTMHMGCLLTWWVKRHKWTCPHCRAVYLEGNDKQDYPEERREGVVNQVIDAITRTIWDLDTDPAPDPEHPHAIIIDDVRFDFVDILDDDLSTLEVLLGR